MQTPIQYEMLSIGYQVDADTEFQTPNELYENAKNFVEGKVKERLKEMENEG